MADLDYDPRPAPHFTQPSWHRHWPDRDPTSADGLYWPREPTTRPGRANIVRHKHVCPDGTEVVVHSQRITTTGVTLDRWVVGGYRVATSSRPSPNSDPPDYSWVDSAA